MLTKYELKMPHAVYSGENALGRIPEIFAANGVRRLVVFTDKGIEGAGLGLYIADHCMREMGGRLVLENGTSGLRAGVWIALSRGI